MQHEDCYLWMDEKVPEDQRTMNVLCLKCHKENPIGWLWEGSRLGYGPFDFVCNQCGHVVHSAPKSNNTKEIGKTNGKS